MKEKKILITKQFTDWLHGIADVRSRRRITLRIQRLKLGLGDCKSVGKGITELRIDMGPGYRVYFVKFEKKEDYVILLLAGGDKDSQTRDIVQSQEMWEKMEDDQDIEGYLSSLEDEHFSI